MILFNLFICGFLFAMAIEKIGASFGWWGVNPTPDGIVALLLIALALTFLNEAMRAYRAKLEQREDSHD